MDTPVAAPREVIVRVEAVGICGSDTADFMVGYVGEWKVDGPLILGHEVGGRVLSIGSDVTRVAVGDRVALEPGRPCRDCHECLAGPYHLCPELQFLATPPYDEALVQQIAMDERNPYVIPQNMSFGQAVLCEPLSVGIWACRRAAVQPGESVLVSGAGPVGILAVQFARAMGAASVTISDMSEFRLGAARELGLSTEESTDPVRENGHERFDVLLECSSAPGVLASGPWELRDNACAAMVGLAEA